MKAIYKFLITSLFNKLKRGRLTMILPNDEKLIFGSVPEELNVQIRIKSEDFFRKCVLFGSVGFGESYVDGDWETDNIRDVISWMLLNIDNHPTIMSNTTKKSPVDVLNVLNKLLFAFRSNTLKGSKKNIVEHYDLGNDFFKIFLDETMTYSSAYYEHEGQDLKSAQVAKIDRLCKKLQLKPTDHLLEVGSGWGALAVHAASYYGCKVTTVTLSENQYAYTKALIEEFGLEELITIELKDYRLLEGKFDKIVSVEMIEAVGDKYLPVYFKKLQSLLKEDGLMAIQGILSADHRYDFTRKNVDWIQKHIFPGSLLPSLRAIQNAISKTGALSLFHFEDMTHHYAQTLCTWSKYFNQRIDDVKSLGLDEEFIRKWNYYLEYCEAAFQMRHISVAQMVFTHPNNHQLKQYTGLMAPSSQSAQPRTVARGEVDPYLIRQIDSLNS